MRLVLEGKTVREVERRALEGIDPNFGTPGKRRNLIRLAIANGKVCAHCGDPVYFIWEKGVNPKYTKSKMATFDHIVTRKAGGTYALENGLLACSDCNGLRGDMELDKFREKIANGDWEPYSKRKEKKLARKARRAAKRAEKMQDPEWQEKHNLFTFKLGYLLYLIQKRDKYLHENLPSQSTSTKRVLKNTSYSTIQRGNAIRSTANADCAVWSFQCDFGSSRGQGRIFKSKCALDDQNRLISPKGQQNG